MTSRSLSLFAVLICSLAIWGCTQSAREPTGEPVYFVSEAPDPDEQLPALAAADESALEALGRAAETNDPDVMEAALAALGTCHAPATCTGIVACSNWSPLVACDSNCPKRCCHDGPACNEPDFGGTITRERFRKCWTAQNVECFEFSHSTVNICGC